MGDLLLKLLVLNQREKEVLDAADLCGSDFARQSARFDPRLRRSAFYLHPIVARFMMQKPGCQPLPAFAAASRRALCNGGEG